MILFSMGIHKQTQRGNYGHKPRQAATMLLLLQQGEQAWVHFFLSLHAHKHNNFHLE